MYSNDEAPSSLREQAVAFLTRNVGRVLGGAAGLIIALLILFIGFWKTLLIVSLVLTGSYLGGKRDKRQTLRNLFDKYIDYFGKR